MKILLKYFLLILGLNINLISDQIEKPKSFYNSQKIENLQLGIDSLPRQTYIEYLSDGRIITFEDDNEIKKLEIDSSISYNYIIEYINGINSKKIILKVRMKENLNYCNLVITLTNSLNYKKKYTYLMQFLGYPSDIKNNLSFNINAWNKNDTIRLTDNNQNYRGSCWFNKRINLVDGFIVKFKVRISNGDNNSCEDFSEKGADGFAFVIQNFSLNACGKSGGGIGYEGISNAMVLEFDTYSNDSNQIENYNDPNGNHCSVFYSLKKDPLIPIHNSIQNFMHYSNLMHLYNDIIYNVQIIYTPESHNYMSSIELFIDSAQVKQQFLYALYNVPFNWFLNLKGKEAYIGFTSSTGCAAATHDIFNFEIYSFTNATSIDDIDKNLYITPNPANDYITIQNINPAKEGIDLEIYNLFGEMIPPRHFASQNATPEVGNLRIDISNLTAGVYFIKIGDKYEKFVKI